MTTILQLADSVTAQLNAASLSQTFTAERLYVPDFDLESMNDLRVTVVPRSIEFLPLDRSSNKVRGQVDVAVQQKFESESSADLDPLVALVEEIADMFRLKRLQSFVAARCVAVENGVLYSSEHLQQLGQFTSLLTLTFELAR